MKIIKKYAAIQMWTETINEHVDVKLRFGDISGPYYSLNYPKQEFDSEEDAIEYAQKTDKWARWMIVPTITFED